jgi:hypothetical protein
LKAHQAQGGLLRSQPTQPTPPPAAVTAAGGGRERVATAAGVPAPEVARALAQLQDACEELEELLDGLTDTVSQVLARSIAVAPLEQPGTPGAVAGTAEARQAAAAAAGNEAAAAVSSENPGAALQDLLSKYECLEELEHLQNWLRSNMNISNSGSGNGVVGSCDLLERAWKLSFAPTAATGLSAALGLAGAAWEDNSKGRDRSRSSSCMVVEALTATDLGMRLELALEQAQELRARLSARLALGG